MTLTPLPKTNSNHYVIQVDSPPKDLRIELAAKDARQVRINYGNLLEKSGELDVATAAQQARARMAARNAPKANLALTNSTTASAKNLTCKILSIATAAFALTTTAYVAAVAYTSDYFNSN